MDNQANNQHTHPEEASYGGCHFRMEYEEMEHKHRRCARMWENIVVGIGFGAVIIMVTMVLVSIGATML